MSIGELKRKTKTAHYHTTLNALKFLELLNLINRESEKDKLGTITVMLTQPSNKATFK